MRPRNAMLLSFALSVACGALAGCGGRTEGEPPSSSEDNQNSSGGRSSGGSTSSPPPDQAFSDDPPTTGTDPDSYLLLGDCSPGSWPVDGEPCPWLADGLCYDTKQAACSCVCPFDAEDSVCLSGLPGDEYARIRVTCS